MDRGNFLFQRFSQGENQVTNNVVLFLQLIYRSSPARFERLLVDLIYDVELSVGPLFSQQVRSRASVPDAVVEQKSFSLFVETKLGKDVYFDQMRRHIEGLRETPGSGSTRVMLALSVTCPPEQEVDQLKKLAKTGARPCQFHATTFERIRDAADKVIPEYDEELRQALSDFDRYLEHENLVDWSQRFLPIFPCGDSFEFNRSLGVYYHPATRPSVAQYDFIGIYTRKAVRVIGRINTVVQASFDGKSPAFETERGAMDDGVRQRVVDTVTAVAGLHDLKSDTHRFYIFEEPLGECLISKVSSGGIQGMRYLDFKTLAESRKEKEYDPSKTYSAPELAAVLDGASFE